jgi:hypothetical protein
MSRFVGRSALLVLTLSIAAPVAAAVVETPGQGRRYSGVLYVAGWKCPPNDDITVRFDGGAPLRAASRLPRGDTAAACGNGGANGYLLQFNFNLLGDGPHSVSVRQDGTPFASSTFDVTTFGQTFLRGAEGTYVLPDFPAAGQEATVEWDQGSQNFVIIGHDPGVSPPPSCPTDGPIQDLTRDCSDLLYGYVSGAVVAGLTSTGDDAIICLAAPGLSVVCVTGPVLSPTTFALDAGNVAGGPFVPLDPGSGGNIASGGRVLNFTVRIDGDVNVFNGFAYFDTQPLGSADAATSSQGPIEDSLRRTAWALTGSIGPGASTIERGQESESAAAIRRALRAMRAEVR